VAQEPPEAVVAALPGGAVLSSGRQQMNWDDDDGHGKAGQFYFNRDDPRILVPQRLGFGRTLNFAHPVSWVLFGAPIAVAVFAAVNKG
jgi:uncharacterized membrane protein